MELSFAKKRCQSYAKPVQTTFQRICQKATSREKQWVETPELCRYDDAVWAVWSRALQLPKPPVAIIDGSSAHALVPHPPARALSRGAAAGHTYINNQPCRVAAPESTALAVAVVLRCCYSYRCCAARCKQRPRKKGRTLAHFSALNQNRFSPCSH